MSWTLEMSNCPSAFWLMVQNTLPNPLCHLLSVSPPSPAITEAEKAQPAPPFSLLHNPAPSRGSLSYRLPSSSWHQLLLLHGSASRGYFPHLLRGCLSASHVSYITQSFRYCQMIDYVLWSGAWQMTDYVLWSQSWQHSCE